MTVSDQVLAKIARVHPTPFYCYDARTIRDRYRYFTERLPDQVQVFYSTKANPNLSVLRIFRQLNAGMEVSSLNEYCLAKAAGVTPDKIIFVGPGKSSAELQSVIADGIHLVVAESIGELVLLDSIATALGRRQKLLLRVNPTFSIAAPSFTMAGVATQFGVEYAQLGEAFGILNNLPSVECVGIQVYLGARVLNFRLLLEAATKIIELAKYVSKHFGVSLEIVDLGGGLGIPLFEGEVDLEIDRFLIGFRSIIDSELKDHPELRFYMEIGRYFVGPAGVFLTRVLYGKSCGAKTFAVCDGGASSHCSAAGYGDPYRKNWPMRKIGMQSGAVEPVTLAGPLCTPIDTLGVDVLLPPLAAGDLLRIDQSGAYGPTHSPVYFISHGFPAEIMVDGEDIILVRPADTADDIIKKYSESRILVVPESVERRD
jgi:diaminopimelate decarboxylase